jgi:hypothetical protein
VCSRVKGWEEWWVKGMVIEWERDLEKNLVVWWVKGLEER